MNYRSRREKNKFYQENQFAALLSKKILSMTIKLNRRFRRHVTSTKLVLENWGCKAPQQANARESVGHVSILNVCYGIIMYQLASP